MTELQPQELEGSVQELEGEFEKEEALSPEVERLIQDLQPARGFVLRLLAARQLGKVSKSRRQVVQALLAAAETDDTAQIRAAAAESLRAPVHQEILQEHPNLMQRAQSATEKAATQREEQKEEPVEPLEAVDRPHSSATPRRRSIILWGALGGVIAVVLFLIPLHGPLWDLLSFQPEAAGISLLFSPIVALVGGALGIVSAAVSIRAIRRPWPQTMVTLGAGMVGGLVTAVGYFGWLIGSALPLVLILSVVGLALYLLSARKKLALAIAGIVLASGAVLGLVWARETEPVNGQHLAIQYQLGKRHFFGADLEGVQLSGATLQGAYLNQANLRKANLSGADLRGAILDGANLNGADLTGANLHRAHLDEAILDGANLTGANLEGALLFRVRIDSRTQLDAKPRLVWELVTQGCRNRDLSDVDLSGARLMRANLPGANLSRANLTGTNLIEAYLSDADLRGANLDGAYLRDANLTRANLRGLDWEGAELRGADLSWADLSGANLSDADLGWTKLEGADLTGADLSGASLRQSRLSQANLRGATVTAEQLREAFALKGAVMPDGTVHE